MSKPEPSADAQAGTSQERLPNPWWILPVLGPIPIGVQQRHLTLMGFVAFAMFFENYDMSLLTSVLKFLGEDFSMNEAQLGSFQGWIRLGTLPAFFVIPFADRLGRKRMFLVSLVGLSVGTFLTAFSQNATQFIACQVLARTFMLTASAISFVFITEEFPAEHRGWGIGMLGAVAALGFGVGALIFAAIEVIPFGWRALYALGITPIFLLPRIAVGLPETKRFEAVTRAAESGPADPVERFGPLSPLVSLATRHPRHAIGVVGLGVLGVMGTAPAFAFTGQFVLEVREWAPWQYSTMFIVCGLFGVIGSPWAGRMGDRYGRKAIAAFMLGVYPLWVFAFYMGPGWATPLAWIGMVFASMSSSVVIRALTNETFPTENRGTAGGVLSLMETMGAAAGLFAFSYWMDVIGQQGLVIGLMSCMAVVSVATIPLFPETSKRELEEIQSPS